MEKKNSGRGFVDGAKNSLMLRVFFIGFLILLFLIPLGMVKGVLFERGSYFNDAVSSISTSWAEEQTVFGPVLVVPYRVEQTIWVYNKEIKQNEVKKREAQRFHYVLPATLKADADLQTQERYRGIYKVPVYQADLSFQGGFSNVFKDLKVAKNERILSYGDAYLSFSVSDMRGVSGDLILLWDKEKKEAEPGVNVNNLQSGFHVKLGQLPRDFKDYSFNVTMALKGIKGFHFVPVGKDTALNMVSNWAHPSFSGRFLPSEREIGDAGFTSTWETGFLATDMGGQFARCVSSNQCGALWVNTFSVKLFSSVNVYQKTERALKYGLLFISLTFGAFFVFETLRDFRIHPIQYGLVGTALAVFYLLLVSLSEHVSFGLSYAVASLAIAGLLGYYVSFVIKSAQWGGVFAALIGGLYGVLYLILKSEDYALLMGSGLLFATLSIVMVMTRTVDWYRVGKNEE